MVAVSVSGEYTSHVAPQMSRLLIAHNKGQHCSMSVQELGRLLNELKYSSLAL